MKQFEQLTIKQVKKEIIAWETEMGSKPKAVEVVSIGQHPDADIYKQGDDTLCEYFFANVIIDGEEKKRFYQWNLDDEEVDTASDEGPLEDDDGGDDSLRGIWWRSGKDTEQ